MCVVCVCCVTRGVCIHMHLSVPTFMCICKCACICMCMYVCMYLCVHTINPYDVSYCLQSVLM